MGAGDDTFVWNPGDGSDTVEGQAGTDTLLFNGANVDEKIDISANGTRAAVHPRRRPTSPWTSTASRRSTSTPSAAPTPSPSTTCPAPTSREVNLDLGAGGGGDGAADTVIVNGTNGDDVITVAGDNGVVTVSGLAATVNITGAERQRPHRHQRPGRRRRRRGVGPQRACSSPPTAATATTS